MIFHRSHFFALALCLTLAGPAALADILKGRVVGVADGDTVTVLDAHKVQHKIRLTGIDAPEKKQPFGQAAKQSLSDLVFNQEVQVAWTKRDQYQRVLGKLLLNEQDICLEQIKRGMAWHYKDYQRDQAPEDRVRYSSAEQSARQARVGLWADASPVRPSEFRRQQKRQQ